VCAGTGVCARIDSEGYTIHASLLVVVAVCVLGTACTREHHQREEEDHKIEERRESARGKRKEERGK